MIGMVVQLKTARLLLQIVDAFIEVWGAGRVGVHLAPRGDSHDMGDDNPLATLVMWLNNWISAMWPLSLPVNMKEDSFAATRYVLNSRGVDC